MDTDDRLSFRGLNNHFNNTTAPHVLVVSDVDLTAKTECSNLTLLLCSRLIKLNLLLSLQMRINTRVKRLPNHIINCKARSQWLVPQWEVQLTL